MKSLRAVVVVSLISLAGPFALSAQEAVPAEQAAVQAPSEIPGAVPRLVKFSGALKDALGEPRTGTLGLTFALYAEQEGGPPLWLETQNVALDPEGRYTVLLGATRREGLPLRLFAANEARWLGLHIEGEEKEQPRVLLVSVPYALKAEEAERLGGKAASEFVLTEDLKSPEGQEKLGLTGGGGPSATATTKASKFKATTAIGPAFIWTGTTGPVLQTPTTALVANLNADLLDTLDSADLQRRVSATCPVGQSIRAIATDGTVTCEPDDVGVSSGGTVTQIDTGTGLTGGPITLAGTVSLNTTFTDGRYLQLLGGTLLGDLAGTRADFSGDVRSNTFHLIPFGTADATSGVSSGFLELFASAFDSDLPGPITPGFRWQVSPVNNNTPSPAGRLELGYSADGSTVGPTGLLINSDGTINFAPGQTFPGTGTATDLNCVNCVSAGEVQFNYAGSATEGGTASNADLLDSLNSTQFARVDAANGFSGTQTAPNFAATSSVTGASGSFSGAAATAVLGSTSSPFGIGVQGSVSDPTGFTLGMFASSASSNGTGIQARASSATGVTKGVEGIVDSASGTAGVFENTAGGAILIGKGSAGALKLTVDGQGNLHARGDVKVGPSPGEFAASGPENLRVLRGLVNSDGTVVNGTGFTVTKNGTGDYTITFSTAFSAAPTPVVTGHSTLGVIANVSDLLTGSFRVQTFVIQALSGATLALNSPFTFIVMGPR